MRLLRTAAACGGEGGGAWKTMVTRCGGVARGRTRWADGAERGRAAGVVRERENTTQSWPAGCFDTLSTFDNTHTHTLFHWAKTSGLWSTQITGGNTDTIERIHKSLGMADKAEVTYRIKTNLNAIM